MAPKKKTVKLPTGEKPKQLSTLAKTVKSAARGGVLNKSGKVEVLTPSQAAARAGKMRDKKPSAKPGTRKITVSVSSTPAKKSSNKTVKAGSMAGSAKLVPDNLAAKKASTKYSPAPMSGAAKAKTRVAAAKKSPTLVSKVVGRAKTVAREVRDIPTAIGTVARATAAGKPKPGTNTPPNKQAMYAKYDLKKQLKQVGSAIKSGKTGTPAVRYGKDKPKR